MADDFFAGVEQVDVRIGDMEAKMPVFYREARSFSALFPAKLWSVRKILPDRRFVPVQMLPGVSAVQLIAFEYEDTDAGPYNEFAIGIPLNSPSFLQAPVYNMLRQMGRMQFHAYVHHLPVTTEIALRGGIDFYGFPKFLASIDFADSDEWTSCEVKEGEEHICTLRGRKLAAGREDEMTFFSYLYQWKKPQVAEVRLNARQYTMTPNPTHAQLELGSRHPMARELSQLLISTRPLLYSYFPSLQMILYGPEYMPLPLLRFSLETAMQVPLERMREEELARSGK